MSSISSMTYEQALDRVTSGRAVGVVRIGSAPSALRADSPDIAPKTAALPATDDPEETRMPGAVCAAYGLNPESPHRKAAIAFIDFPGSAKGQNLYNRTGGTLPAIPNTSFTVDPAVKEVAERQRSSTTVPFMDQRWPNSAVQSTHFDRVHALFAGTGSLDDALTALDRAYAQGD